MLFERSFPPFLKLDLVFLGFLSTLNQELRQEKHNAQYPEKVELRASENNMTNAGKRPTKQQIWKIKAKQNLDLTQKMNE